MPEGHSRALSTHLREAAYRVGITDPDAMEVSEAASVVLERSQSIPIQHTRQHFAQRAQPQLRPSSDFMSESLKFLRGAQKVAKYVSELKRHFIISHSLVEQVRKAATTHDTD